MRISDWSSDVCSSDLWLPSHRLRDWLKHKVTKHLFQHRYDYREEWLRFTRTIGQRGSPQKSLHERLIKAMTAITERKSVVKGKSVSVRVDLVGRRIIKKKHIHQCKTYENTTDK